MKTKHLVIGIALLAIVALGAYAWAGPGGGWGRGCGGGYGMGGGAWQQLSEADAQKAAEERQAFFEATRELRRNLYQKQTELDSEMAKDTLDGARVSALQKEISDLGAELDQKWVSHRVRMKAIAPELGSGPGAGCGGRGRGACYRNAARSSAACGSGGPCYGAGYGQGGRNCFGGCRR